MKSSAHSFTAMLPFRKQQLYRGFFLLFIFLSIAQTTAAQTETEYTVKRYSSKNGLPQNSIKSMAMDDKRFLWLSTEGGLVRFDGQQFKVYNQTNHPGIRNNRFMSIKKTSDNHLVVNEWRGNTFGIEGGKISQILSWSEELPSEATIAGGIPNVDFLKTMKKDTIAGIPTTQLTSYPVNIFNFTADRFAIRTLDGIRFFRENKFEKDIFIGPNVIHEIFMCEGIIFYIDKNKEWFYVDADNNKVVRTKLTGSIPDDVVKKYSFTKSIIWSNAYPDVYMKIQNNLHQIHFDSTSASLTSTLITSRLPNSCQVSDAFFDEKSRSLFVGTDTKGLYVFKKSIFKTLIYDDPNVGLNNSYYSQIPIDSNTVFSGYRREFTIKGGKLSDLPLIRYNPENLLIDRNNTVWYSHQNIIYKYSIPEKSTTQINANMRGDFTCFRENGDSILAAHFDVVGFIKDSSFVVLAKTPDDFPDSRIEDILMGPDNRIWIAKCNGVMACTPGKDKFRFIPGLEGVCARVLFKDQENVFIGTYGNGYFIWKNGKLIKPPLDRNKFLSHAHSFFIDKNNFLWMSTNKGLFRVPYQQVLSYIQDTTNTLQYEYFGDDDGILNTEFNGGCTPSVVRLKNGYVSYPTMEGLVWFVPESIPSTTSDEEILIDDIYIDGTLVESNTLSIPSKHQMIKINYSTPYWGNNTNLELEYQLQGFSDQWNDLDAEQTSINFSSLPSGNYKLLIRKLNKSSDGNYIAAELNFEVEKHIYETFLFQFLVTIGLLSLIIYLFRLNTARVRNKNIQLEQRIAERTKELQLANHKLEENIEVLAEQESYLKESISTKDKLISVISHDIITPLKFISMVSRISKKNPDMIDRSKLIESMNDIEFASDKLYNNAKNILDWMKFQNNKINPQLHHIAVHEYIDEIIEPLKGMADIKHISIINHVNEEDIIITDRNIFMIILQNVLTNAIKYTEKGRIQFSAAADHLKYTITVEDTGIGMSKETLDEIQRIKTGAASDPKRIKRDTDIGNQLGYIIISDLLDMIGGDFKIVSFPGIGSKVTIIIPQSENNE